jgi:hypothetical protein
VSEQFNFNDGNKCELVSIDKSGDVWVRHDIKPLDVAKIIKTMSERIKRLEDVGDKMEIYCDTILARDWKEAKEAKP